MRIIILSLMALILSACSNENTTKQSKEEKSMNKEVTTTPSDPTQTEIDEIYSLLAYAIVYKYWESDDRNGRGYNVASVLSNPDNEVLDWGINKVNEAENCTQHGEVRLMTRFLDKDGIYSLKDHNMYTTLEPCAMCAGMMTMASVKRSINGQRDYYFSKALERLSFDSEEIGGYPPYPRIVMSEETPSKYGQTLDDAYQKYIKEGNKPIITKFLATPEAKKVYADASESFKNFKVKHTSNQTIHRKALDFFNALPDEPK